MTDKAPRGPWATHAKKWVQLLLMEEEIELLKDRCEACGHLDALHVESDYGSEFCLVGECPCRDRETPNKGSEQ